MYDDTKHTLKHAAEFNDGAYEEERHRTRELAFEVAARKALPPAQVMIRGFYLDKISDFAGQRRMRLERQPPLLRVVIAQRSPVIKGGVFFVWLIMCIQTNKKAKSIRYHHVRRRSKGWVRGLQRTITRICTPRSGLAKEMGWGCGAHGTRFETMAILVKELLSATKLLHAHA